MGIPEGEEGRTGSEKNFFKKWLKTAKGLKSKIEETDQ